MNSVVERVARFQMLSSDHLIGSLPVAQWRNAVGRGHTWRLIMGADAGPRFSVAALALVGRLYMEDDFDTVVIIEDLSVERLHAAADFADMIVSHYALKGYPKAEALFTGPGSVPQDTYLATELDKRERRSHLFVHSTEQPEGRKCFRCDKGEQGQGWNMIESMLALRNGPQGTPRPRLMFCVEASQTYEALRAQESNTCEDHSVAALRYLVWGWHKASNWML